VYWLQSSHQGGAHGGRAPAKIVRAPAKIVRAPAKIVRAPAKITGLIVFHLGCQIKNWYFGHFYFLVLIIRQMCDIHVDLHVADV